METKNPKYINTNLLGRGIDIKKGDKMNLTKADKYALLGLVPAACILVAVVLGLQFIAPLRKAAYILAGILMTVAYYITLLMLVHLHHVRKPKQ